MTGKAFGCAYLKFVLFQNVHIGSDVTLASVMRLEACVENIQSADIAE